MADLIALPKKSHLLNVGIHIVTKILMQRIIFNFSKKYTINGENQLIKNALDIWIIL